MSRADMMSHYGKMSADWDCEILYSPQLNKLYNGKRSYKGKDFTPIYMPFPNDSTSPSLEFLAGGACVFANTDEGKVKAAKQFVSFMGKDEEWGQN